MVITENLIKLGEESSFAICGGLVETVFVVDNELRGLVRNNKVELAIFVDSFGGAKPERLVFNDCAAGGKVIIPAQQVWNVLPGNIRTIEYVIPVVCGRQAMNVISPRFCDDVDHASRGMSELRLVSAGDDLELSDGVLIELRRRATIQFVLIGQAINEKT